MKMNHLPNLEDLRLPSKMPVRAALPTVKVSGTFRAIFLRGPVSWPWLNRAALIPGRALHVALAIRLWAGIRKTNCIVLPSGELARMGVNRHAAYRAVRALEGAGLLTVTRQTGRKTRVCVIEITDGREREVEPRDDSTTGGHKCVVCCRNITRDDVVTRKPSASASRHAVCKPPRSRHRRQEAVLPLFDAPLPLFDAVPIGASGRRQG